MAKEDSLIIGSIYGAPKADKDETLEKWEHIITQRKFLIGGDDFNAYFRLWGYTNEKCSGETLTEYLNAKNLTIVNTENKEANYKKYNTKVELLAQG